MRMSLARDRSGFGLLEIMVAMGLLGVMALAVTSLSTSMTKTGKNSEQTLALSILMSAVQANLQDHKSCQSVFRNVTFDLSPSAPLVQNLDSITIEIPSTGQVITVAEVNALYSGLLLEQIRLERSAAPINATPIPQGAVTYNLYPYKLRLQLKRDTKQTYGEPLLTKEFTGLLSLNTVGGSVLACSGASFDPEQVCTTMGGTWDAAATPPKCDFGPNNYESHIVVGGTSAFCPAGEILTGGGARNNGAKDTHGTYPCGTNGWCCHIEKPGNCYAVCLRKKATP